MHMLIGEYTHSFDDKNRISLPAKFRSEIGRKVVVTRGLDNCLFIYSEKEWRRISEKLGALPMGSPDSRGFGRFMFGGAAQVDVDTAGRMLVPDFLRSFAKITETAVFVGVHDRVEMWNESAWVSYKGRIEQQGDALADKLGEVGFI
jgi:MraZ protein